MSSRIDEVTGEPQTVDEARNAVERSRQRMSSTLDQLEDRIVEKKHEIEERVDVARPLREQVTQRPFTVMAVALGVGALLGSLGGSDDSGRRDSGSDDYRPRSSRGRSSGDTLSREERAELREWRRHRREHLSRMESSSSDSGSGRLDGMKHQLMGALTTAIGTVVTAKVKEFTGVGSGQQRPLHSGGEYDGVRDFDRSMR